MVIIFMSLAAPLSALYAPYHFALEQRSSTDILSGASARITSQLFHLTSYLRPQSLMAKPSVTFPSMAEAQLHIISMNMMPLQIIFNLPMRSG